MKTTLHRARTRGGANHGWLKTFHTFSFANYYDPKRVHFGALRVLNDDVVEPGEGFGIHPHDNMEIITIPLQGSLQHRDSMGNVAVISKGEIQVMTAGTGIMHSEYNNSNREPVNFLQIWVFPRERGLEPGYSQVKIKLPEKNSIETIVSPTGAAGTARVHQDVWFSLADISEGNSVKYTLHKADSGIYVFVLEGQAEVAGEKLSKRDGMGIEDFDSVDISTDSSANLLIMEVPMR